jgi:glycosyltransferase involved in cell wall biosynthesis
MPTETPLVAVAVPCYQHGLLLGPMLESLLAQTFRRWECRVVIDGRDALAERVAQMYAATDPRIAVTILDRHVGLPNARNQAIRATRAGWVLPFDADDTMDSAYIERLHATADALEPDAERYPVVFTPARLTYSDGRVPETFVYPPYVPAEMAEYVQMPGCALMPRALFDRLNGYDPAWDQGATDWMFYCRAAALNLLRPIQLPEPLWTYRQHAGHRNSQRGAAVLPYLRAEMRRAVAGERAYGEPLAIPAHEPPGHVDTNVDNDVDN